MLEVSRLQKADEKLWDEYVFKSNKSTFYHQLGWRNVIVKTYGHKPIYLVAKEDGEFRGILPLFLMKSRIFGRKIISVPFAPYGGVCADNPRIENLLVNEAIKITKEYDAEYLELRNAINKLNLKNLIERSIHVTSILELAPNPDILWSRVKRDKKRGIKKAKKAKLKVIWGIEGVNDFYKIYTHTMKTLGTPAHSIKFFSNIIKEFSDKCNIINVSYEDNIIASIFLLFFKDKVVSGWSGSLKEYLRLYPNNLAYWEAISYFCKRGYKYFDFGRSIPNSGVHEFKKSFGARTIYLHYYYYLNSLVEVPDTTVLSSSRQKFAKVWKKLPLPIVNLIGPKIRMNFP